MADPLALSADIESRGHPIVDDDEQARLEHLLRLGSALLRRRFSTIDARIAAATLDPVLVADVLVAMVLRAPSTVDPDRIRSESVSDDTYAVTYAGVTGPSGVELWLTGQEEALLTLPTEERPLFGSARLRAMLS